MSKHNRAPAEVFPPGEFLREELEARGWSEKDFAERSGIALAIVKEILLSKCAITPDIARAIGEALGTGAQVWRHL